MANIPPLLWDSRFNEPEYPDPVVRENQPVFGRPEPDLSKTGWRFPATGIKIIRKPDEPLFLNLNRTLDTQGLRNLEGVCYRNACLQVLLNLPVFVNFCLDHRRNCPHRVDCLICLFRAVINEYHGRPRANEADLATAVQIFWDACLRVFWGPLAGRPRRIGPFSLAIGGDHASLMFWLIKTMREQLRDCPSELQLLERIFIRQVVKTTVCGNPDCGNHSNPLYRDYVQTIITLKAGDSGDIQDYVRRQPYGIPKRFSLESACEQCGRTINLYDREESRNLPAVLMIYALRQPAHTQRLIPTPLVRRIEVPNGVGGAMATYELTAVTVEPSGWVPGGISHIFSIVTDRTGVLAVVNDEQCSYITDWDEQDRRQFLGDENERLMPQLLVYTRKTEEKPMMLRSGRHVGVVSPSNNTQQPVDASWDDKQDIRQKVAARVSMDGGTPQDVNDITVLVNEIGEAVPHIAPDVVIETYFTFRGDLDAIMLSLVADPRLDIDLSLNNVDLDTRPAMLKLYANFPSAHRLHLASALHTNNLDYEAAFEQLKSVSHVALQFQEDIGKARIAIKIRADPTENYEHDTWQDDHDFPLQRLQGEYVYQFMGKAWFTRFYGMARRMPHWEQQMRDHNFGM